LNEQPLAVGPSIMIDLLYETFEGLIIGYPMSAVFGLEIGLRCGQRPVLWSSAHH
jgi:hypothetical protein